MRKLLMTLTIAVTLPAASQGDFLGVYVTAAYRSGHIEGKNTQDGEPVQFQLVDVGQPRGYFQVRPGDLLVLGGSPAYGWTAMRGDGAVWRFDVYAPKPHQR
jgi:hypothetical protein